jgi:hypothetical protein
MVHLVLSRSKLRAEVLARQVLVPNHQKDYILHHEKLLGLVWALPRLQLLRPSLEMLSLLEREVQITLFYIQTLEQLRALVRQLQEILQSVCTLTFALQPVKELAVLAIQLSKVIFVQQAPRVVQLQEMRQRVYTLPLELQTAMEPVTQRHQL